MAGQAHHQQTSAGSAAEFDCPVTVQGRYLRIRTTTRTPRCPSRTRLSRRWTESEPPELPTTKSQLGSSSEESIVRPLSSPLNRRASQGGLDRDFKFPNIRVLPVEEELPEWAPQACSTFRGPQGDITDRECYNPVQVVDGRRAAHDVVYSTNLSVDSRDWVRRHPWPTSAPSRAAPRRGLKKHPIFDAAEEERLRTQIYNLQKMRDELHVERNELHRKFRIERTTLADLEPRAKALAAERDVLLKSMEELRVREANSNAQKAQAIHEASWSMSEMLRMQEERDHALAERDRALNERDATRDVLREMFAAQTLPTRLPATSTHAEVQEDMAQRTELQAVTNADTKDSSRGRRVNGARRESLASQSSQVDRPSQDRSHSCPPIL
ncbi:hypothetical protein PLICRDRAFT_42534 [Plicaturopsis crispa FD-325 SS-3]|nr:hypothetical protein PLICRDRAFT_42534 [Plicaturopsis crispa FD-325 SS-3]